MYVKALILKSAEYKCDVNVSITKEMKRLENGWTDLENFR